MGAPPSAQIPATIAQGAGAPNPSNDTTAPFGDVGGTLSSQQNVPARRVVVVDDYRMFAELLELGLGAHPKLTCVGTAGTISSAVQLIAREQPDVVVMDVRLGQESGVDATATITKQWPEVAVLILTAHPTPHLMSEAVRAGASAMLSKGGALDELLDMVLRVRPHQFTVTAHLMDSLLSAPEGPVSPCTPREHEVLTLLAAGHDVRWISKELDISPH